MPASDRQVVPRAAVNAALPDDPAVRVAFTGRADGNLSQVVGEGDVRSARARVLEALGQPVTHGVFMEQVHGDRVAVVGVEDRGRGLDDHADAIGGVDALVTTAVDVALVVMVADCVPVLLAAPGRGVAAVHAGRRGLAGGIVPTAVAALTEACGTPAPEVVALLGPAIGGCCYEVPEGVAREVADVVPAARAVTTWGTPALDLPAAAEAQLRAAGVARVRRETACTRCDPDAWFSHRAVTSGGVPDGRQAGLIVRVAPNDTDPSLD